MQSKSIPAPYLRLLEQLAPLVDQKTSGTIAVDGLDHSGKSTVARFLAWQLHISLIETDLLLIPPSEPLNYDLDVLKRLVQMRHAMNRHIIVEGLFTLKLLEGIGVAASVTIRTECAARKGCLGSWPNQFAAYHQAYPSALAPSFTVSW